uniref:ATP binding cassette subfamily A member 5 n=1 Tax=Nothobranchius furzeri TaxID=105023 RepID=A0A8C6L2L8_NOTFU
MQDRLEFFASEEDLENASLYDPSSYIGVVFLNSAATSYKLRFPYNKLPLSRDYTESVASCYSSLEKCRAANYWLSGFSHLQSLIDAAIIQMQTKRSVWKELSLNVFMMGQPSFVEVHEFPHALISIYLVLAFTPFVTFLIVNVVAEKEHRLKDTMTMMGLYNTAFWLSWGLLYAALVTAMSILMALIATVTSLFPNSDFFIIFFLNFLYGISSIFFSFMLTPLFKKPKFASTVGSMLTVVFGCMSLFVVLMKDFPQPLVWLLCLLSPSAFSIGIAQVSHGPYPLYVPLFMLAVDCVLYLLLAVYLDQVIPGDFGMRRSLLYFLKPSYWSKDRKRYVEVSSVYDAEANGAPAGEECIEPVSPEFRGKEAIRINNIRKVYKDKDNMVEALRGLTFDIYEGQITALLGHSGAGKSTLMNTLCGICPPTNGSATIYGSPVAEVAEGSEMKQLVGICPQFNIIFDVLTVEEHLKIFAAIKGIPPADVKTEVTKVLKDLDLEKIMTAQAKNLSASQKRKLSVGIAILGNPKILLLDEPTAGMDPCSRHQVWSLLKKLRAGRVIVLSTHYMDEADILADRKAVISQGQLKCVGSSLYLKIKCGVGYHLSEGCNAESVVSLVNRHVPKAKLSRQHEAELTFTLPFESMDTFPGLFSELDSQPKLGIINYGVSMTTLEDVFLRLEAENEVDQAGGLQRRLLSFSDNKSAVSGHALWWQQFSAVAWLHMLNMRRDTTVHALPMAVNILSNAILRGLNGSGQIRTWTKPFENVIMKLRVSDQQTFFPPQIKCRSMLQISGLLPSAYWCGQAAVDIPFYYLILSLMNIILFSFHSGNLLVSGNLTSLVSVILLTYVVSFGFTRVQSNRDFFSFVSMMVRPQLFGLTLSLHRISSKSKPKLDWAPDEGMNEDEDVQIEKARVKEALTCQSCEEKPVVVVHNLRKQYRGRKEGFSFGKKTKVATKNVSFCVRKGEVLGLLGPNGSGKSTIMHMLAGVTNPTAGQFHPVDNPLEHVGYCPQLNPLWPRITLQEHLEIYAAIKGLKGQDVPGIIKRVSNALEVKDHLHKPAKSLSAGLKRKLCFALSMIGNPQIVLLDEPSSGMDPKSKQRMWRAIRAAFRNCQRGAILTTHYMEEAEAVCDRVAIMVSGQLRCIGSIQHLKGKFGQGYSLEVKLREEHMGLPQVALLHDEILRIFPHAARQESFTTLMVYKIPMEDVKFLAQAFSQLENAKKTFDFEEYNFSQSTLEQVFLEFAKEQEIDDDEVGSISTTFQWQRLHQDGAVPTHHADSIVHQL